MRRLLIGTGILLAVAAGVAAGLGRIQWADWGWYYHFNADHRLQVGLAALQHGDLERTSAIIQNLEHAGHVEHAALLQGEWLYLQPTPLIESSHIPQVTNLLVRALTE